MIRLSRAGNECFAVLATAVLVVRWVPTLAELWWQAARGLLTRIVDPPIIGPFLATLIQRGRNPSMPTVRVKENEPFEVALRRFKRSCEKAGVLTEVRRREFYEKPTEERKRKAAAARKRALKRMRRQSMRLVRLY